MQPEVEAFLLKYLLNRLDKMWAWHGPRKACKKASCIGRINGIEHFRCAACKLAVAKVEIDHIAAKGKRPRKLNELIPYIERYFCDITNLQSLCVACHKHKTKTDVRKIRNLTGK